MATWKDVIYSATYACPDHPEVNLEELAPRMFSFNTPYGACPECDGLGTILEFDPDLIVPDASLCLSQGAIDAWRHGGKRMNIFYNRLIRRFCRDNGVSPDEAYAKLSAGRPQAAACTATDDFEGVMPNLTRRWQNTDSEFVKTQLHGYLSEQPCRGCHGARLKPASAGGADRRR